MSDREESPLCARMLDTLRARLDDRDDPAANEMLDVISMEDMAAVLQAIHDYLFEAADLVSNLRKPYTDNAYGGAAQMILRCFRPGKIDAILAQPPYSQ